MKASTSQPEIAAQRPILDVEMADATAQPAGSQPSRLKATLAVLRNVTIAYFLQFRGLKAGPFPKRPALYAVMWSWIGAFTGIGLLGILHYIVGVPEHNNVLIGSFGAASILSYGAFDSPFAQPRNTVISHPMCGLIGVAFNVLVSTKWVAAGCAVAFSLSAMQLTRTVHPPAGATALIAVLSNVTTFTYAIWPVGFGVVFITLVALVVDNLHKQYPLYWIRPKKLKLPTSHPVANSAATISELAPPTHDIPNGTKHKPDSCCCDCVCQCRAVLGDSRGVHTEHCIHHGHHHTPCLHDAAREVILVSTLTQSIASERNRTVEQAPAQIEMSNVTVRLNGDQQLDGSQEEKTNDTATSSQFARVDEAGPDDNLDRDGFDIFTEPLPIDDLDDEADNSLPMDKSTD